MGRPVIYASTLTRREVRLRRARRRGVVLGPRLAALAVWGSATAFAIVVIERLM